MNGPKRRSLSVCHHLDAKQENPAPGIEMGYNLLSPLGSLFTTGSWIASGSTCRDCPSTAWSSLAATASRPRPPLCALLILAVLAKLIVAKTQGSFLTAERGEGREFVSLSQQAAAGHPIPSLRGRIYPSLSFRGLGCEH